MSVNDRIFNIQDAELISHGEVVAATLPTDLNEFVIFDSTFNDSYPQAIKDGIGEVMAIRTDNVVIDEMAELTLRVNDTLAACNTCFKTIRFFVKKAFKDNTAIQNQLGVNDLRNVRTNVPKMVVFMNDLAGVIEKYRDDLISGGCNVTVLDQVPVLGKQLSEDNMKQEQFKKERGLITHERVEKLNALYLLLKPLSQIAHIIFSDNPAKLAQYALPRPKSSTDNPEDLLLS